MTNAAVVEQISTLSSLEAKVAKHKLSYSGDIMTRKDGME